MHKIKTLPSHKCRNADQRKKGRGRGEKKSTAPSPYPTKHHPYTRLCSLLSLKKVSLGGGVLSLKHKSREANEQSSAPGEKKGGFPRLLRFFPAAGDKSFWKVESCPKGDHTHSLESAQLLGAGRQADTHSRIHTRTLTHSRTKWRL